jgi:hypothetical protein
VPAFPDRIGAPRSLFQTEMELTPNTRLPGRLLALAVPLALLLAILLVPARNADAAILGPPAGKVMTGVSDTGKIEDFLGFADMTGKHPAVLQTFHPWGNGLNIAYRRWQNAEVRPMLHISTADDETRAEIITPQEIATGAGDPYLLEINQFFAEKDLRAYIRPLGEPNRCLNPYSAVDCVGRLKGGEHTPYWYRKAFQRISVIVRGGLPANRIDRKLNRLRMPNVNHGARTRPAVLPAPPVSIVWSTLPAGSPRAKGNWPANYWPGPNFVDWAGVDFYSNYPEWKFLNKFFRNRTWRGKPIALAEWGIAGSDNVRFTRQLFHWMEKRKRVRMFNYYRGFGGPEDIFNPVNYPNAMRVLRNKLKKPRYMPYAYGHARR